jgi:hypothetical protein
MYFDKLWSGSCDSLMKYYIAEGELGATKSEIHNPKSTIRNPQSEIHNPKSEINLIEK